MSLREPGRSSGKSFQSLEPSPFVPGWRRQSSHNFYQVADFILEYLYKTLGCFNGTDDKSFPTCGFSVMPALLDFSWLYSVTRK